MSFLETEVISELINNINEEKKNIKNKIDIKKKDTISEKDCCIAAVKYNTIGNAYKDIKNNIPVYLVREEKNGVMKKYAYARCSKTTQDGTNFCHLHCRMTKYNNDGLKIFERDILPTKNDKLRFLANTNDDFFDNMGKRGAKKKNNENNYTFLNQNHPILLILNHKNPKLTSMLSLYASQLLKNNNVSNNKEFINLKEDAVNTHKNVSNSNKILNKDELKEDNLDKDKNNNKKIETIEDNEDIEDSEDNGDIEDNEDNEDSEDSEDVYNNSDDEGVSCISISSLKGRQLWLNEEDNTVYEPQDDDNGEEIGILKEISFGYHTIIHNKKNYTVIKEIKVKNRTNVLCCVLSDLLFNQDLIHIGKRKKLNNNEYSFEFFDEM